MTEITLMTPERFAALDTEMQAMHETWRSRWCGGGMCACMGCANRSGGLLGKGFTEAEWKEYCAAKGIVAPPVPTSEEVHRVLRQIFGNPVE
ncbi:hypothetical protein HNP46_000276 [Pseudomonas nitritireducens]|uniref:Uncharacterized protein n=1 Tax=Pseudomonas nitroreducens TaxID=46680 RepID=A0A7W7KFB8_PSENT|nr:hypothetical protein [Pseudomonas nitritireducens]MBB4861465.1 hypothetical protein [Pseudomonas nitritireducens]